jgi:hypothetical protein
MKKNKDYFIIDTFISKDEQDRLEDLIFKTKINWFLSDDPLRTVSEDVHLRELKVFPNIFEYGQFVHVLVSYDPNTNKSTNNSVIFNSIHDILKNTAQFFKCSLDVLRAKINLQTKVYLSNRLLHNTPHVDLLLTGDNYWTMVYFVIDSDGPLRLFNSDNSVVESIEPKKGRAVIFRNFIKHCGVHPTKNNFRSVLNLNFLTILPENLDR